MPRMTVTHRGDNLPRYFKERGLTLKNSMEGLLRRAGRLCAVQLANRTQPFGFGAGSQAVGQVATITQIYRVYATPGKAWKDINNTGAAAGFWRAIIARQWGRAGKILARSATSMKSTPIQQFDNGAAHRQLRNRQGRIPQSQKPVMIVQNTQALKTYVTTEANKVGFGKAGWAACAKALGGSRGIPGWVSRHKAPGTVIENYGGKPMTITMTNQVPYASEILDDAQRAEAVQIAIDRLYADLRSASAGKKITATELINA